MLWGESWLNLQMIVSDIPFFDYDAKAGSGNTDSDELESVEDFIEFLG